MNPNKTDYHFQTVKGRCAEALIEELFLLNGYDVFRFGMENTIPGILKKIKKSNDIATNRIRSLPDLLVTKNDKTFLIEVKYRADGKFLRNRDLHRDFPYRECFFIIVSKENIKCIKYEEMTHKGQEILSDDEEHLLSERKEFSLSKDSIKTFESVANMIFDGVTSKISDKR